jgi:hypothetical protein
MRRLLLAVLALLALVVPALAQDQLPAPRNIVVLYDSSGSMWNRPAGREARFELAREAMRVVTDEILSRPPGAVQGLGMASMGKRFPRAAGRCDDLDVEARLADPRATDVVARMRAAADDMRPSGLTPLYDLMLEGASLSRPGEPVSLLIITDLDDEYCGRPPCEVLSRLAEQGRPHPMVTRLHWMILIGVDLAQSRHAAELQACAPGLRIIAIHSSAEARQRIPELLRDLTAQTGTIELMLQVPPETLRLPGDLRRTGLSWDVRVGGAARYDTITQERTLIRELPAGPIGLRVTHGPDEVREWPARVDPTRLSSETVLLQPARVEVDAADLSAATRFNWRIEDMLEGHVREVASTSPLLLLPGRYRINVSYEDRRGQIETTLRLRETHRIALFPRAAPQPVAARPATLRVETRHGPPGALAPPGSIERVQVVGGRQPLTFDGDRELQLEPGSYRVVSGGRPETAVPLTEGSRVIIRLHAGASRLRMELEQPPADTAIWRIQRPADGALLELAGHLVDLAVAPGRYQINVTAGPFVGNRTVDVPADTYIRENMRLGLPTGEQAPPPEPSRSLGPSRDRR